MPRIDPLKLLTCLKVLLAPNGGIRSANEVKRLAELMAKYSKKLVSKCIYIQILKCTDTELLGKFMGVGGWLLTHMWLSEGIRAMNWPLVQEILELLLLCPVDVQRLRSNTAPKLVKGLSKDGGNEGVRILAAKLVEQWLKVVKGETMGSTEIAQNNLLVNTATETAESKEKRAASNSFLNANSLIVQPKNEDEVGKFQGDSLAIPSSSSADISTNLMSSIKIKSSDALVYKIVVKDGKQILAKVVNDAADALDGKTENSEKNEPDQTSKVDENSGDKQSNKENEVTKSKESAENDSQERDTEKEKSRSSKDKEKHRDHRSSSSSHHKSSSSKSSSKSSSSSSSSSSSKIKSHRSSESNNRHKDKENNSDREKSKSASSPSRKSSSNHSSKDRSSKHKERGRTKENDKSQEREKSQFEKDRDTLSKISPTSIEKLGKIPKKSKETDSETLVTSIVIPSKKASMSIEIRRDNNRPKTVKTYNSQFRSHGLSEEAPPPPSRKGLKKPPVQSVPGTAIPPTLFTKRLSPPPQPAPVNSASAVKELHPPAEKKIKIDLTTAPAFEKLGAVKFIAPKPKPSTLVESDMFMDALSASAPKKDLRKRKRRTSSSKDAGKDGSPPESPISNKVAPLKFYQDTLEDDDKVESLDDSRDESKDDGTDDKKNDDEDDIPLKRVKEQIEERVREEKELEERLIRENEEPDENPIKKPPGPGCGPNGPPGVLMLHRRRGPKKKLKWRAQEQLEEIRYFEMDENERVNVTKTFTDMKQMERINERDAFVLARKLNCEDVMTEQIAWTQLILVDDVPSHPEGSQSKEKKIQSERELTTLKALYFNRHMIPESASEPDMEQYQLTEPAVIPLDDITGNPDAVNDFTSMPWPDPKGSPPQGDDFVGGPDMPFPGGQFNPFMPFGGNSGWMGPGPNNGPINGVMPPPGMVGPMGGGFNNMMGGPPQNIMMGGPPPNMMMGGPPDDMGMNCNMNMMQPPFGPNFGGPPNNVMGGFNNFGPPNMNMSPPGMNMNMNNGPPRGGGGGRGGNWRSGSAGPPGGGNWRPQGGPPGGGGRNWMHGNSNGRICKQYQRGFCRNGTKCNFVHPPTNNQRF